MGKNKKKVNTERYNIKYNATLKFEEGEFIIYPKAQVYRGHKPIERIPLTDISEMESGITLQSYMAAMSGEEVEVVYIDHNPIHRL